MLYPFSIQEFYTKCEMKGFIFLVIKLIEKKKESKIFLQHKEAMKHKVKERRNLNIS